jgi:hypothetical protein
LTCLHLHLYSRVISDCEWAHRLNENSLKAWLYKARAYYEKGEACKAADCLREAESRNPGSKAQIQGTLFMRISINHQQHSQAVLQPFLSYTYHLEALTLLVWLNLVFEKISERDLFFHLSTNAIKPCVAFQQQKLCYNANNKVVPKAMPLISLYD